MSSGFTTGFPSYDPNRDDRPGISDASLRKFYGMDIEPQPGLPFDPVLGAGPIPLPRSVLPHDQVQALETHGASHRSLKKRQAQNRQIVADLRFAIAAFQKESDQQPLSERLMGLPDRQAKIDHASAALAEALGDQPRIAEEVRKSEGLLQAARAKMREIAVSELRARASKADQLFKQLEVISDEMDAIEAQSADLELELRHPYGHVDPIAWGGYSFVRRHEIVINPDGRRTRVMGGRSDYQCEKQRKMMIGMLEEVAS